MVEPTENWGRHDKACFGKTSSVGNGCVAEGLMAAASVVVIDELAEDLPEVSFAEHDDVVEAFSAECAIDALDEAVLPGQLRCRLDRLDIEIANAVVEPRAEDLIAVVNQKSRLGSVTWECLDHLSQRPGCRWIRRDVEVDDASPVVTEDDSLKNAVGTTMKSHAAVPFM